MISFTELAKWLVLLIRLRSHSTATFFGFKRPYLGNRSEIAPAALSSSPSAHDLSVGTAASESPRAESTPAANLPPRLRAARPEGRRARGADAGQPGRRRSQSGLGQGGAWRPDRPSASQSREFKDRVQYRLAYASVRVNRENQAWRSDRPRESQAPILRSWAQGPGALV